MGQDRLKEEWEDGTEFFEMEMRRRVVFLSLYYYMEPDVAGQVL